MKKYLFITLTLFISLAARANFNCTSLDQQSSLTIENKATPQEMLITLSNESTKSVFDGVANDVDGELLTQQVIQLSANQGTITITSKPKFCGRAGCFGNSFFDWHASLQLNSQPEILFSCHETNP